MKAARRDLLNIWVPAIGAGRLTPEVETRMLTAKGALRASQTPLNQAHNGRSSRGSLRIRISLSDRLPVPQRPWLARFADSGRSPGDGHVLHQSCDARPCPRHDSTFPRHADNARSAANEDVRDKMARSAWFLGLVPISEYSA